MRIGLASNQWRPDLNIHSFLLCMIVLYKYIQWKIEDLKHRRWILMIHKCTLVEMCSYREWRKWTNWYARRGCCMMQRLLKGSWPPTNFLCHTRYYWQCGSVIIAENAPHIVCLRLSRLDILQFQLKTELADIGRS